MHPLVLQHGWRTLCCCRMGCGALHGAAVWVAMVHRPLPHRLRWRHLAFCLPTWPPVHLLTAAGHQCAVRRREGGCGGVRPVAGAAATVQGALHDCTAGWLWGLPLVSSKGQGHAAGSGVAVALAPTAARTVPSKQPRPACTCPAHRPPCCSALCCPVHCPTLPLPQGLFYTVWPVSEHMYPRCAQRAQHAQHAQRAHACEQLPRKVSGHAVAGRLIVGDAPCPLPELHWLSPAPVPFLSCGSPFCTYCCPPCRSLRLKYRPNLISLAGGMQELPITQPEARAIPTPVSPQPPLALPPWALPAAAARLCFLRPHAGSASTRWCAPARPAARA